MTSSTTKTLQPSVASRLVVAACLLGALAPAVAQGQNRTNSRNSLAVRSAFRDVVAEARQSVVRVRTKGRTIAFGTIVAEDGYVLTKASELTGPLTCKLSDGRELDADIIGVREDYDLAMLRIDADDLRPANWNLAEEEVAGRWCITPGIKEDPVSVGVISVSRRRIQPISGILGILMDQNAEGGAKVTEVTEGSGAAKAGLKVDDLITYVNRTPIESSEDLSQSLGSYTVGDIVRLRVRRGEDENTIEAKLGPRQRNSGRRRGRGRSSFQNAMGGALSDRASGFPSAIQHDTVLRPSECGGPLLDLEGRVIGINIARAGRVMSFALPASEVHVLLDDLKSGEYSPYVDFRGNDKSGDGNRAR
ncbi:MAG: S1C family serine protease [Pirellulales bacterium]|nr:S1C family serine protease [Pirellulales bacterium]